MCVYLRDSSLTLITRLGRAGEADECPNQYKLDQLHHIQGQDLLPPMCHAWHIVSTVNVVEFPLAGKA